MCEVKALEVSERGGQCIKASYLWEVESNFLTGEPSSPKFAVPGYGDDKWHLEWDHWGKQRTCDEYLTYYALYLKLDGQPQSYSINLLLGFVDAERKYLYKCEQSGILDILQGFDEFVTCDEFDEKRSSWEFDGVLRVMCEIQLLSEFDSKPVKNIFHLPKHTLSDDIGSLFNDPATADVTLAAGSTLFHAHKVILSARSPYFRGMFKSNFKENIQNSVELKDESGEDMNEDLANAVLRFIYTGKVLNLANKAIALISAADMYGLETLKVMCEDTLFDTIDVENAAEVLTVAHRYNVPKLKGHVQHFIKSNKFRVIHTSGFKEMEEHHGHLIIEMFKMFAL